MIIEGEFFSGGHLRWNLGWPTPNYSGAFLVTLLALIFVFSGSRWRWAFLATETGGLFLLAKTYSRGAVVAWGLAWLFGVAASRGWKVPAERLVWVARAGVLAVMLFAVGFGWSRAVEKTTGPQDDRTTDKRATASEVPSTEDGSVVNRLSLWRGGLKMIAAAPLTGWGAGESGRAYMNWFQDIDRTEGYTTMVNSYLHIGVEHGLPVLWVVFFGAGCLLVMAWSGARNESASPASRLLHVAAGASLMAWAVANVFTTLWIEPKLWVVPLLAIGLLVNVTFRQRRANWRWLAGVAGMSSLAVMVLYSAGVWLDRENPWRIQPVAPNWVEMFEEPGTPNATPANWWVWPDREVLGSYPGKELRRWLASKPGSMKISVAQGWDASAPALSDRVMLFGQQASRLGALNVAQVERLYVVHPLGAPPKTVSVPRGKIAVILPEIDQAGNAPAWRKWAEAQGAEVKVTSGVGTDIRSVWPEVAKTWGND